MEKIIKFLSGKKTYLVAFIYLGLLAYNGEALDENMVPDTGAVLALLAATLRSGMAKNGS